MKYHRHCSRRRRLQNMLLHLPHHMHFALPAVEFQPELLAAVDERHRLGAHLALHADHALGLFRAQAQRVADAVTRDHQRHFACLLVLLVGGLDQLYAVFDVEGLCGRVVDVGEVGEGLFRVLCGRLCCCLARHALVGGEARGFELLDGIAAQFIEQGAGDEPGLRPEDGDGLIILATMMS